MQPKSPSLSQDLRTPPYAGGVFRQTAVYSVPAGAYVCFATVGERRQRLTLGAPDAEGIEALATLVASFDPEERRGLLAIMGTAGFAAQLVQTYVGPSGRPFPKDMILSPDNLLNHWDRAATLVDPVSNAAVSSATPPVRLFVTSALCAVMNAGTHPKGSRAQFIRPAPTFATLRVTRGVQGFNDLRFGFWLAAFAKELERLVTHAAKTLDVVRTDEAWLSIHTVGETCQAFFQSLQAALMHAALPDRTFMVAIGEVRRRLCTGAFSATATEAMLDGPLSALLANLNVVMLALDEDTPAAQISPAEVAILAQHLAVLAEALQPRLRLWQQVPVAEFAGYFEIERRYRFGSPIPLTVCVSRRVAPGPLLRAAQTVYMSSAAPGSPRWTLLSPLTAVVRGLPEANLSVAPAWEALHGEGVRADLDKLLLMNSPWHSISLLQLVSSEELWLLSLIHGGRLDITTLMTSAWRGLHSGSLELRSPLPGLEGQPADLPPPMGVTAQQAGSYYDVPGTDTVPLSIEGSLHVQLSDGRLSTQLPLLGLAELANQESASFADPLFALAFGRLRAGIPASHYPVSVFEPPVGPSDEGKPFPVVNTRSLSFPELDKRLSHSFVTAPFSPVVFDAQIDHASAGRGRTIEVQLPESIVHRVIDPRSGAPRTKLTMRVGAGELIVGPYLSTRVAETMAFGFGGSESVRMMPALLSSLHVEAQLRLHQKIMMLPVDSEAARVLARRHVLASWMRATQTPFVRQTIANVIGITRVLTFVDQTSVEGAMIIAATKIAITREIIGAVTDSPSAYALWKRLMVEDVNLMRALDENVLELLERPIHVAMQDGGEETLR